MTKEEQHCTEQISELHEQLDQERKKSRQTNWIFGSVMFVMIFGFLGWMQQSVKNSFSEEAIKEASRGMMARISPMLPQYLAQMVEGLPEIVQQQVSDKVMQELPKLGENIKFSAQDMEKKLAEYASIQIAEQILANPELKKVMNENKLHEEEIKNLNQMVLNESVKLADRISIKILELYEHDLDELNKLVDDFPRDRRSTDDDKMAIKMLVHYLLQLADHEVMQNTHETVAQNRI